MVEKKKGSSYLLDVLDAVSLLDDKKRNKEDHSKEHKVAVQAIKIANSVYYNGYISISKARSIIQDRRK